MWGCVGSRGMLPVFDDPTSRHHDVADGRIPAREQQMIQSRIRCRPDQGWMGIVQHQPVGAAPNLEGAGGLADGPGAAVRRIAP